MHKVHAIIKAFGGPSRLAEVTGNPQQTVSYWHTREPPEIPPAQRLGVLLAAQSHGVSLPAGALEYLHSRERTPKATPTEQAAA